MKFLSSRVLFLLPLYCIALPASAEENPSTSEKPSAEQKEETTEQSKDSKKSTTQIAATQPNSDQKKNLKAPSMGDLKSFRNGMERFRQRVESFEAQVGQTVRAQQKLEEQKISREYDGRIKALKADSDYLRTTSVSRFEDFIKRYPKRQESAQIMVQLANFYFDISKDKYNKGIEVSEADSSVEPPEDIDFSPSIVLYDRVIRNFPNSKYIDQALYMHGWCHWEDNSKQNSAKTYLNSFSTLVSKYPKSKYTPQANYLLGVYYFDNDDLRSAISYFNKALKSSKESEKTFETSLYRLAWSHYRRDDFDDAIKYMLALLDFSERSLKQSGSEALTRPEAIEYTAYSFTDISDRKNKPPTTIARSYFNKFGSKPYEVEIYQKMADQLIEQDRISEAIDTFAYIQKQWPYHPDNPTMQYNIATLYGTLGEEKLYTKAMTKLTNLYDDTCQADLSKICNTKWFEKNQSNPDATDLARRYIESSLRQVAYNKFNLALASKDTVAFSEAADYFGRYLDKFFLADDYYEVQWAKAQALFLGEKLDDAAKQYEEMLRNRKNHDFAELSVYRLHTIYGIKLLDIHKGNFQETPSSAVVERNEDLADKSGKMAVYSLGKMQKNYLRTYRDLSRTSFNSRVVAVRNKMKETEAALSKVRTKSEKERLSEKLKTEKNVIENLRGFRDFFKQKEADYVLKIGQIFYAHKQMKNSRNWLNRVIDTWPDKDEAQQAAKLLIQTYIDQRDHKNVIAESRRILDKLVPPGERSTSELASLFADAQLDSALAMAINISKEAKKLMTSGKIEKASEEYAKAGAAFERFLKDHPNSEDYANTLLLAAENWDSSGNSQKANALYQRFVDKFPEHQKSPYQLFRIANNYQNALDYNKAIKYFQKLYDYTYGKGKPYPDALGGLYNVSLLKIGVGDYAGAARGLEKYASAFAKGAEAEKVAFSAGKQWEKVSDRKGLDFYRRYLSKYGGQNPDNTMSAHYQRIQLMSKMGNKKKFIEQEWAAIKKRYDAFAEAGQLSPEVRRIGGMSQSRLVTKQIAALERYEYSENDAKNAKMALVDMEERVKKIFEFCNSLSNYDDFDTLIASYYCKGKTALYYATFIEEYPIPEDLPPAGEDYLMEQIEAIFEPYEQKGKEALEKAKEFSEKGERWSVWTTKALNTLNEYYSSEFPLEQTEVRVMQSSEYVPLQGPYSPKVIEAVKPVKPVDKDSGTDAKSADKSTESTEKKQAEEKSSPDTGGEQQPAKPADKKNPKENSSETSSEQKNNIWGESQPDKSDSSKQQNGGGE